MTIGMKTIERINNIQIRAKQLGFLFAEDPWSPDSDNISLVVIHETLPRFVEGSKVYSGNLDEVDAFTRGLIWARHYDTLLGLKTEQRRAVSEKKLRNRLLLKNIKESTDEY